MMRQITLLLLISQLTFSCATIFTGSRDPILFTTKPAGAMVTIDELRVGETPILLDVKRTVGQRWATIELDGYETEHLRLKGKFNWVSVVNYTCLICWSVDLATGSVSKFKDKNVALELVPAIVPDTTAMGRIP